MLRLASVAVFAALCSAAVPQDFVNTKAVRKIDATNGVVSAVTSFKLSGKGSGKYYLAFTEQEAAHLAGVSAVDEDSGEQYDVVKDTTEHKSGFVHYIVKMKKAPTSESAVGLKVTAVYAGALSALPAEISQKEEQKVVLPLNAYVTSPYTTEKQATHVKLPSSAVEGEPAGPEPVSLDGSKLKYGAYSGVEGYSVSTSSVHYTLDSAIPHLISCYREIEVSLWGNIAVEEHYDLQVQGAKLKTGFSRIDYQMQRTQAPVLTGITASLPKHASAVYYRDVIGNISTSAVRTESSRVSMETSFRFPLLGGWRTQWYQGYNVPTGSYLTASVDAATGEQVFTLKYDAHIPYPGLPIADYTLKVILPEGAVVRSVESPFAAATSNSRRFTYLDSPLVGRPVAILHADGTLVSQVTSTGPVVVTFTASPLALLYKPLYCVTAFALMFAAYMLLSRIDLSLGKPVAGGKKQQ